MSAAMTAFTARAPANIAFTKYWGCRDEKLTLPFHDTISMNLSACVTETTVERPAGGEGDAGGGDEVALFGPDGAPLALREEGGRQIAAHLDYLAERARDAGTLRGERPPFRVTSRNSMPAGAGVASSASGFAALTLAAAAALGLRPDTRAASLWARRSGSGSAARSVPDGFVRWHAGDAPDGSDSFAESLFPPEHWELADVVAIVDTAPKKTSSRDGHRLAPSSPHFRHRLALLPERNDRALRALWHRDIELLGSVLEEEALSLHEIAETSAGATRYRTAATDRVLQEVRVRRRAGLAAWFTLDAGPNVHVICEAANRDRVAAALREVEGVRAILLNGPAPGARLSPGE